MHTTTEYTNGYLGSENLTESCKVEKLQLVNQTEEEIEEANAQKKEKARRIALKKEASSKIEKSVKKGTGANAKIDTIVWDCLNEICYSFHELRVFAFNALKQDILKMVSRHAGAVGDKRSTYVSGGVVDSIYTSTDPQFLIGKIATFRRSMNTQGDMERVAMKRLQEIMPGVDVEQLILDFMNGTDK